MVSGDYYDQVKQAWIKNMGVDNPSKSDSVKAKKRQTYLKNFGVDHHTKTEEGRKNASEFGKRARANDPILTCPHCGKTAKGLGLMNRWHFDKCKFKAA